MKTILNKISFFSEIISSPQKLIKKGQEEVGGILRVDYRRILDDTTYEIFNFVQVNKFENGVLHLEFSGKGNREQYLLLINDLLKFYGSDSNGNTTPSDDYSIEDGDFDYTWYFKNDKHELIEEDDDMYYGVNLSCFSDKCLLTVLNYHNANSQFSKEFL